MVNPTAQTYPARLQIDYPERLDRVSSAFRLIWIIPIAVVLTVLSASANQTVTRVSGNVATTTTRSGGGIEAGLFVATLLTLIFLPALYASWYGAKKPLAA